MSEALWPASPAKVGDEWGVKLETAPPDAEPGMVVSCSVTSKAGKKWTRDYRLVEETQWGWTAVAVEKSDQSQPTAADPDPASGFTKQPSITAPPAIDLESMAGLLSVLSSIERHLSRIADALAPNHEDESAR